MREEDLNLLFLKGCGALLAAGEQELGDLLCALIAKYRTLDNEHRALVKKYEKNIKRSLPSRGHNRRMKRLANLVAFGVLGDKMQVRVDGKKCKNDLLVFLRDYGPLKMDRSPQITNDHNQIKETTHGNEPIDED